MASGSGLVVILAEVAAELVTGVLGSQPLETAKLPVSRLRPHPRQFSGDRLDSGDLHDWHQPGPAAAQEAAWLLPAAKASGDRAIAAWYTKLCGLSFG